MPSYVQFKCWEYKELLQQSDTELNCVSLCLFSCNFTGNGKICIKINFSSLSVQKMDETKLQK